MLIRTLAVLLSLAAMCFPGSAKTVRTDTIILQPNSKDTKSGTGPSIPVDDLGPTGGVSEPKSDADGTFTEEVVEPVAPPEVFYTTDHLPKPVARMQAQLLETAVAGDVERLRMILEANEVMPTLSFTEIGDPIEFLRESSGDPDGTEILAILADTMDAGYVHADKGTPHEMYIWPYFARYPFAQLSATQKVEMYRIITAADFAEMEAYGAWLFYRVGIGPDGTLHYFVAGD